MKIQDMGFLGLLTLLIYFKKPRLSAVVGLACLVLSMPLFHFWIFFTAERLTWYAAAFFIHSIILLIIDKPKS